MVGKYIFKSSMPPTRISAALLPTGTKRSKVFIWRAGKQFLFCSKVHHTCAAAAAAAAAGAIQASPTEVHKRIPANSNFWNGHGFLRSLSSALNWDISYSYLCNATVSRIYGISNNFIISLLCSRPLIKISLFKCKTQCIKSSIYLNAKCLFCKCFFYPCCQDGEKWLLRKYTWVWGTTRCSPAAHMLCPTRDS